MCIRDRITGGSYVKLKENPSKVYKVTDVNCELIDATQKDKKRVVLNISDVELDVYKRQLPKQSNFAPEPALWTWVQEEVSPVFL